jgi:hypothetical protein
LRHNPNPIGLAEVYAALILMDDHDWSLAGVARALRRDQEALDRRIRLERRKARVPHNSSQNGTNSSQNGTIHER